jgi:hypothetical protein
MDVPAFVWLLTILGIVGLVAFDFFFHVRTAHIPTLREAAVWSAVYLIKPGDSESRAPDNLVIRLARRLRNTTEHYAATNCS